MTRAQPCDMLPTRRISPLRTNQSVPFTSRICVIADADRLDHAGRRPEVDDITDAELVLADHEQAVEHVFHDVLGAEAEAGAERGGDQRERAVIAGAIVVDDQQRSRRSRSTAFTTLLSTPPRVRVRCTMRTAASGEASSAWVSSVLLLLGAVDDAVARRVG